MLKVVEMLSECQTAWIQERRRVNRSLIRIQALCNCSCELRAKGYCCVVLSNSLTYLEVLNAICWVIVVDFLGYNLDVVFFELTYEIVNGL